MARQRSNARTGKDERDLAGAGSLPTIFIAIGAGLATATALNVLGLLTYNPAMRKHLRQLPFLLICTLLVVQFLQAQMHLHLCLDPGAQEAAIHVASADHAEAGDHHQAGDDEIELKAQGGTRPATPFDNPLPALLAAFVILLLLPLVTRVVPPAISATARPTRAWRLLPPAHAPPAHS